MRAECKRCGEVLIIPEPPAKDSMGEAMRASKLALAEYAFYETHKDCPGRVDAVSTASHMLAS